MGEEKGSGCSKVSECETRARGSAGYDLEGERIASHLSSRGLSQPLEAVRNVPRSPKRSSSSRSGDSRDLVSERTPESSLAEQELLSPLLSEWKSADDKELGVMSGNERLLLRLGATSLELVASDTAGKSDPGDKVLLARLRFMEGGGGSSLGIVCLYLPGREQRHWLATESLYLLILPCSAAFTEKMCCTSMRAFSLSFHFADSDSARSSLCTKQVYENKPQASFPLHQSHYTPLT